jgi:hypothetical protein
MACRKKNKMDFGGVVSSFLEGSNPYLTGLTTGIINDIQYVNNYGKNQQKGTLYNFNNTNTPIMPMGGIVPSKTVELEKGEPYMYPNGGMGMISENAPTHAQGGVPITLPTGTKVLGKKPTMNNKTFKEMGVKLKRKGDKYKKVLDNKPTRIAERTANLMLEKINKEFNNLFTQQEEIGNTNKMPEGGTVGDLGYLRKQAQKYSMPYRTTDTYSFTPEQIRSASYNDIISQRPFYEPNTKNVLGYERYRKGVSGPTYDLINTNDDTGKFNFNGRNLLSESVLPTYAKGGSINIKPSKRGTFTAAATKHNKSVQGFASQVLSNKENYSPAMVKKANFARNASKWRKGEDGLQVYQNGGGINPIQPYVTGGFDPNEVLQQAYSPQYNTVNYTNPEINTNNNNYKPNLNPTSTGMLGSLLPVGYNLIQGASQPDLLDNNAFQNPYANEAMNLISNRTYNIQPELEANRLAEATYYRNLRENAPSQGQLLGGIQAGQVATQRANANAYARQQNVNNQYRADQAQFINQIGNQDTERQRYIEDINARTTANKKRMIGQGLSQVGQYTQNSALMSNQMIRDAQRLNLLPALVQNFELNPDGTWTFKGSGETMNAEDVWNYIKGIK